MRKRLLLIAVVAAAAVLWLLTRQTVAPTAGATAAELTVADTSRARAAPSGSQLHVEVPPPPFSEGVFPCSDCHNDKDLPTNRTRRPLVDAHDEIVLKHDEEHRWCLDCHDADNRDRLHLAGGEAVPFEESYRVCGQCHGEKYRDWRAGVHGRRVGEWNGAKRYLLCVHCHSPHEPRFKSIAPKPAPNRPSRRGGYGG